MVPRLTYLLTIILQLFSFTKAAVSDSAFNNFIQELYTADTDRATSSQLRVDFQSYANNRQMVDQASRKLFKDVSSDLLSKPVYKTFIALLDNYYSNTGKREDETEAERREIDDFLEEILNTRVFNRTYDFLRNQKHPSTWSRRHFKESLKTVWFDYYSRLRGVADTSAFEHVFAGEISERNNEIGGMHNWVRFHMGEKDGSVDYAGYVVKRKNVALVVFRWKNLWKTTGSFIIGTSPAFDMAVYSLCFWLKPGFRTCRFNLDGCDVEITSHPAQQNGKTFIGTAFPSPGRPSSTCR